MLFIQSYFKLLISLARNRWRMLGISEFEPHQMFPFVFFRLRNGVPTYRNFLQQTHLMIQTPRFKY